jgi:hypothetical protein
MKSRKIYVLRTGGLSKIDNRFHFYDIEVFSSNKKINEEVKKRIEINKGENIRYDEGFCGYGTYDNTLITYDSLDTDGNPMTIRYEVLEKKLN